MTNQTLEAALNYHARGLSLLPIKLGTKEPALRQWKCFQNAGPTEAMLKQWFEKGQRSIAILAGKVSGELVVRDFDSLDGYKQWAADQPELAKSLPTVETVRGRHVYARGSTEAIRKLSKGGGAILDFGDGELRAGGYCLAPPSIHPSGKPYHWVVPLAGELPILDVVQAGFLPQGWQQSAATIASYQKKSPSTHPSTHSSSQPCSAEGAENTAGAVGAEDPRTLKTFVGVIQAPCEVQITEAAERAIRATLPKGVAQRHRHIFELARALKAIPGLADADGKALRGIVQQWHKLAMPAISTKAFDDTWFDFLEGWGKVRFPKGSEPMALMFAAAIEADTPAEAQQYEQEKLRVLVALCREMQRGAGSGPFFLSARTAARLLGIDPATAARWLRGLRHDGILHLAEAGRREARMANSYRYLAAV